MIRQSTTLDRRTFRGFCLSVFAAALLCGATFAAAPPAAPLPPEEPAPGPLVEQRAGLFGVIDANHMALAAFGNSMTPSTGRFALMGAIYAGSDGGEGIQAWTLDGVNTNKHSRISLATTTTVAAGLGSGGWRSLSVLGSLIHGADLPDSWAFIDTDSFRALPKEWLSQVTDNTQMTVGGAEGQVYTDVLVRALYTSPKAFAKALRKDVTYIHINEQPERYRGTVIRVEGRILLVNRFDPPWSASQRGLNDLYEAWVFSEQVGASPYCVIFMGWPEGMSRDLLGKKIDPNADGQVRVSVDGFFFKKLNYKANDGRPAMRQAPMIIANTLKFLSQTPQKERQSAWLSGMMTGFVVVFGTFMIGGIALTLWFRRTDDAIRKRILARMPEFALPPPEPIPQSHIPLASPVMPNSGQDRVAPQIHSRITFPANSGDKGTKDANGAGEQEKPPDEAPGA
jgi:hypothetical protein